MDPPSVAPHETIASTRPKPTSAGEDAPASIDGTLMACAPVGAVLTIGLDQAQSYAWHDGVVVISGSK